MQARRSLARLRSFPCHGAGWCLAAALGMVFGICASDAGGHQNPFTCTHAGSVFLDFLTFRSDGVTPVSVDETVSPCETIVYQVRLSKQTDPTVCAFEGGRIFITTPDGVQHDVTPATGIPCVGGTTSTCDPTVTSVDSQRLSFTINQPSGFLGAVANYGLPVNGVCQANSFCGTAHTGIPDLENTLSQTTAARIAVQSCPPLPGLPCFFSCDPNLKDVSGVRMGLCTDDPSHVTNACDDGDPCTEDTCCPTCPILCAHTRICVCGKGRVDMCRPLQGPCDIPEFCDGTNETCPADQVLPIGTSCGGPGDVCNGRDPVCPNNCGNGIVERDLGETCDDGRDRNGTATDGCQQNCRLKCGDGMVEDLLEQCDPRDPATEQNCTPECRFKCTSGDDCKRDNRDSPSRCTRSLCEKGLCATEMGCTLDPCSGVSGDLDRLVCGLERQLGGADCASGADQKVAKSVTRRLTRLARRLETASALCGKAEGPKTIQRLLNGADRKLGQLQLLAARSVDSPQCFDELNGLAFENDGRLASLRQTVRELLQKHVTCEQLKAGVNPSRDW